MPSIVSVQVSLPLTHVDDEGEWTTAFYKQPVQGQVAATLLGLAGDVVADPLSHGGEDKAVLAYSRDHFAAWREELGMDGLGGGGFGENLTVEGLDEETVCIGDVFRAGSVLLEVAQPRPPCGKLARRWRSQELPRRVIETARTGFYMRVLEEGTLAAGDALVLLARPFRQWTVAETVRLAWTRSSSRRARLALASCPALAEGLGHQLLRRAG